MSKQYRIAVLGLTHDHVWSNLEELAELDNGQLVAAADPNQPLLARVEDAYGVSTYQSHDDLFDREQIDAVYIFSDNASGAELAVQSAQRGLHAMVEKPMAGTLADARRMLAASRENDTRLMINWPFAWWPNMQQAVLNALDGKIGKVWQVRYRAAHAGPKESGCSEYFCDWLFDAQRNGGGAIIDYCCYGALLAHVMMGSPKHVYGLAGRFQKEDIPVDDNAVLLMSYEKGIATAEGSWTQADNLSSYTAIIFGTEATLMVGPRGDGKLLRGDAENQGGVDLDVAKPLPHMQSASSHFLWGLESEWNYFAMVDPALCCGAQEILQAGVNSVDSGAKVKLPL